jgi:hypothetical protein
MLSCRLAAAVLLALGTAAAVPFTTTRVQAPSAVPQHSVAEIALTFAMGSNEVIITNPPPRFFWMSI